MEKRLALAIDTSTEYLVIALGNEQRVLAEICCYFPRLHQEKIVGTVDWVLKQAGVSLADIQLLIVGLGPGSYTGVRVGVAVARAWAYSLGKDLVGVASLDALAHRFAYFPGYIVPLVDAKRGEVYYGLYQGGKDFKRLSQLQVARPEKVVKFIEELEGDVCLTGDAIRAFPSQFAKLNLLKKQPSSSWFLRGESLLKLGLEESRKKLPIDKVVPIYLRPSYAEESGKSEN
jgi:tRNA threonylcarbamoyladenosine biosynthesis protein TsaB